MLDRKIAPKIIDPIDFNLTLKPYQKWSLANNTPVYAVDAGAEEVVSVELLFEAGAGLETKPQVAAAVNQLLKNGTKTKSAFEIAEAFDFYGAYLNVGSSSEYASISLSCLTKHLPVLLPMVTELLTESVFPEEELSIYIQNSLQRLEMNLRKGDFVAGRLIDAYVYGDKHPYGKYTHKEDLSALNSDDLRAYYTRHYSKGNCKIFVAGKLPANIETLLNSAFGHLPFENKISILSSIDYSKAPATQKTNILINDESSVQGAIRLAREMPNRKSPDWPKLQVLNTVFGGYFGSRLMSNIREDKGYTYGIHSYLQGHIHESAWVISTEAGKDVSAATVEEVWKEAAELKEELIDAEELKLVKNYVIGSILGSLDGPFHIIGRWKSYILHDLPADYFQQNITAIKSVQPEELRELARKYLTEDAFYQLTVF